jgi:hypothetical protein
MKTKKTRDRPRRRHSSCHLDTKIAYRFGCSGRTVSFSFFRREYPPSAHAPAGYAVSPGLREHQTRGGTPLLAGGDTMPDL